MIITIDGPVASGKSVVAKHLAERLGWYYLSTGMLYRALAHLLVERSGYNEDQLESPSGADLDTYLNPSRLIYFFSKEKGFGVSFDGVDITPVLKGDAIDRHASITSANKLVREKLLGFQRKFAETHDLVAEGRDCGSVVFPNAELKFFLTAEPKIRAERLRRWYEQKGDARSLESVLEELVERDERDSSRDIAPLTVPKGAIMVDSSDATATGCSIEWVVDVMADEAKRLTQQN